MLGKLEELKKSYDNKQKYNNELREQRMDRLTKEKDVLVKEKFK